MQRRSVLMVLALTAVGLLACSKDTEATPSAEKLKSLTVDQVAAKLDAKDAKTFVYDNNNQKRYANGHVPTAKWLDEDSVTTAALPADKAATLIFYCHDEA